MHPKIVTNSNNCSKDKRKIQFLVFFFFLSLSKIPMELIGGPVPYGWII